MNKNSQFNVLFWGTYDNQAPRLRILMRGLKENNVQTSECHHHIWGAQKDKSQIKKTKTKIYYFIKLLFSYPALIINFLVKKKPDLIFIGYLGHFDILIIYPFAKLRGIPIVWDSYISLYDTVVNDRLLISNKSYIAKFLYTIEYLSCLCADLIVLDTAAHARYFKEQYNINDNKLCSIFVGVEPEFFYKKKSLKNVDNKVKNILFYGQFIPLHGIETIVKAAKILEHEKIIFTLIGTGQTASQIDKEIHDNCLANIRTIKWVKYEELIISIHKADICLGIFGTSKKASRVIPNKVFQILASGKPLITLDSPAIRELLPTNLSQITLIPPGDPAKLSQSILDMLNNNESAYDNNELISKFSPDILGKELLKHVFTRLTLNPAYSSH